MKRASVAAVQIMNISVSRCTRIEGKCTGIVRKAVKWMRIKPHCHRIVCLVLVTAVALLGVGG